MAAFSSYYETSIIQWARGNSMPSSPNYLVMALFTGDPLDDNSGNYEVTGDSNYQRQQIILSNPASVVTQGTNVVNTNDILFGPATVNWGAITHWAIFADDGRYLLHGEFDPSAVQMITQGSSHVTRSGQFKWVVR